MPHPQVDPAESEACWCFHAEGCHDPGPGG
jgi:hypothetical protein